MFEGQKVARKIKAFRKEVVCKRYNQEDCTIEVQSSRKTAQLTFLLISFDGKLQIAFSGDVIASDGEALSCVMKAMWNHKLPEVMQDNEELRKQVGKQQKKEETGNWNEELYFCDMLDSVAGMPNEVVTVKTIYRIDNQ